MNYNTMFVETNNYAYADYFIHRKMRFTVYYKSMRMTTIDQITLVLTKATVNITLFEINQNNRIS